MEKIYDVLLHDKTTREEEIRKKKTEWINKFQDLHKYYDVLGKIHVYVYFTRWELNQHGIWINDGGIYEPEDYSEFLSEAPKAYVKLKTKIDKKLQKQYQALQSKQEAKSPNLVYDYALKEEVIPQKLTICCDNCRFSKGYRSIGMKECDHKRFDECNLSYSQYKPYIKVLKKKKKKKKKKEKQKRTQPDAIQKLQQQSLALANRLSADEIDRKSLSQSIEEIQNEIKSLKRIHDLNTNHFQESIESFQLKCSDIQLQINSLSKPINVDKIMEDVVHGNEKEVKTPFPRITITQTDIDNRKCEYCLYGNNTNPHQKGRGIDGCISRNDDLAPDEDCFVLDDEHYVLESEEPFQKEEITRQQFNKHKCRYCKHTPDHKFRSNDPCYQRWKDLGKTSENCYEFDTEYYIIKAEEPFQKEEITSKMIDDCNCKYCSYGYNFNPYLEKKSFSCLNERPEINCFELDDEHYTVKITPPQHLSVEERKQIFAKNGFTLDYLVKQYCTRCQHGPDYYQCTYTETPSCQRSNGLPSFRPKEN